MATRAQIIDSYFQNQNYFPQVHYKPIGSILVDEVKRQGVNGLYLSTAAALVEQESGGKNIFGCDWSNKWINVPPYCNVEVTQARVKALIKNYYEPPVGQGANGIGYTQLTSMDYVGQAQRIGGAHLAAQNMRVGFGVLLGHIKNLGWPAGAAAYNAGAGNWQSVIDTYGAQVELKERQWAARLLKASDVPGTSRVFPRETLIPHRFVSLPPRNGGYQDMHPTRYAWEPEVAALIHRMYERFGTNIHINTYHYHPGDDNNAWSRDTRAFDVWGANGRNDPLPYGIGAEVWHFLYDDPNPPNIDWIIYRRTIRDNDSGYAPSPFGTAPFSWHDDHIHCTYQGAWRILP